MTFPEPIRTETERLCSSENINALEQTARRISEGYRSDNAHRTIGGEREILVYAASRMPATFGAVSRALELSLECFGGEIRSIADYGAGTGAGIIAASMLTDCEELFAYEQEPNMQKLGKRFCEILDIPVNWENCDITRNFPDRKTDLAICAYCLNELPEHAQEKTLDRLADSANRLIIVEPGTPAAFTQMKKFRSTLTERGFAIAAPCPHSGECPLPADDWCHFSERVQRSALHKRLKGGDAPYEDEKFCFLAAEKNPAPCETRVLRKPIIQAGKITLNLCTENGIETRIVTKSNPQFKKARKAEVGDSFPK
ncbi:MAG: small ribosomal subunit Rsm22 family protein [Oscillospiraceae bacterium]